MNDGIEYAKLIGVPSSSCEYVHKKKKPSFFKKRTLIRKVNEELTAPAETDDGEHAECKCEVCAKDDEKEQTDVYKKEKRLGNLITAQVVAAFVLIAAILLTNIFWENSGINTLLRNVFGNESVNEQIADERVYSDFSLNLPVKNEGVTLVKGVISVTGEYAIYPVCEGKIDKVEKKSDGSYTVTVKHSDTFSSVIEGADLVYFSAGDSVNRNVPLCHAKDKASVYLYDNGTLLTDYAAVENTIVFNK